MSPFERLGIDHHSSEREIKKAYRRLALATHPDKFPDPKDKEGATAAFRELHDAYEQAMQRAVKSPAAANRARQNNNNNNAAPTTEPSPQETTEPAAEESTPKATRDDADIRQAFNDVCDELDRESMERKKKSESEFARVLVPLVAATWPNREECWKVADKACVFSDEIQDLANHFATSVPLLSQFLKDRAGIRSAQRIAKFADQNRERARYVDQNWPAKADDVKARATKDWMLTDLAYVAKLVRDPMASRAILQWKKEKLAAMKRRCEARIRDSAKEIVRVFPNKAKIVGILGRHLRFDRPEIYALLPEDIRGGMDDLFDDKAAICGPDVGRQATPPPTTSSGNAGRADDASEDAPTLASTLNLAFLFVLGCLAGGLFCPRRQDSEN